MVPKILGVLLLLGLGGISHSATFTVDNTNDSGTGSLRQAILEANSVLLPESVFIHFDLPTSTGPPFPLPLFPVINPTSPLPAILRPVRIDGTTQPGTFNRVAVQGGSSTPGDGLHFGPNSDGSVVLGMVFNSWSDDGIELEQSDGTAVAGNWIGVDFFQGTLDLGNGAAGIHVNNSSFTSIGGLTAPDRNVISGTNGNGVWIINGSTGTHVIGNYIGTNVAGTSAISNTNTGVLIVASSGNYVGGPTLGERNLISGNGTGVAVVGSNARDNFIQGNFIGTDANGAADLGNLLDGIRVELAQNTLIGGDSPVDGQPPGNVISGNGMNGVLVRSASVTTIQGNIIGGNASQTADVPNTDDGIRVDDSSGGVAPRHTVIGGRGGLGNSISGNVDNGVYIRDGTGAVVQGNTILRNEDHGLRISTDFNLIGGPSPEDGNVIAHNLQNGIRLSSADENLIGGATAEGGTYIFGNAQNGILMTSSADENRIEGCSIGRDDQGAASPNGLYGVNIDGEDNIVGGTESHKANVIVANVLGGVFIDNNGEDNRIQGNGIGVGLDLVTKGSFSNGNGVVITTGFDNIIGGTEPGAGNVISGNDGDGVLIEAGAFDNLVQGNFIGLLVDGQTAFGNGGSGIAIIDSPNNSIGGNVSEARNVIGANDGDGISISGGGLSTGTVIQGNYVGVDASGALSKGNQRNGIYAHAEALILGGTTAVERNLISGNGSNGVALSGAATIGCVVAGNLIGTDAAGTAALGNNGDGVFLEGADANVIGGTQTGSANVIAANGGNGVRLTVLADDNRILGNRIGTNATGNTNLGNGQNGVLIEDAQLNLVGGAQPGAANIISGTNQYGVRIDNPKAKGNRVQGNIIGADITGSLDLGNRFGGVLIVDASDNFIGGAEAGMGNLISGNGGSGIQMMKTMNTPGRTLIQGNRIGTDVTGTAALGNMSRGIDLSAAVGVVIGGTTEGARNLISGNGFSGVLFHDVATECRIQGNFIGTDITGTLPLGNFFDGVFLENAPNSLVGGATPGAGNLISGNGTYGVHFLDSDATGNLVQGNRIGTDLSGTADIGNASAGIYIKAATGNILGGTGAGEGNLIAYNLAGVDILSGSMNPILSNSIFSNDGLGIDLGEDGVTANDDIDSDTGANDFQNHPLILDATLTATGSSGHGSLESATQTEFLIQIFANEICDATGFGEGANLIASVTATTDDSGFAEFDFETPQVFSTLTYFTATATSPEGNTSEFGRCFESIPPPTATPTSTSTFTPTSTPTATNTPGGPTETFTPTITPGGPTLTPTPTATPTGTCPGLRDITGGGSINASDLLLLIEDERTDEPRSDLNCDGQVNDLDLFLFSQGWASAP